MKKLWMVAAALMISGCANHYYRVSGNFVDILLRAEAREVYFFTSIDDYRPQKACQEGKNLWRVTVPEKAEFRYFYRVDGRIFLPPDCRYTEYDGFGSKSCIYVPKL
jgi:hypothetical protein